MSLRGELHQPRHQRRVPGGSRVLERAHANVAGGHAGEYGAGQYPLAHHLLAGGHDRQRTGGGDTERVHRLADDELAQHRADGSLAVPATGERGAAGTLQVQVAGASVHVGEFAEQQCSPVTEPRRVVAELVAGIGLGHGGRVVGQALTEQRRDALVRAQRRRVEAELGRKVIVPGQQGR